MNRNPIFGNVGSSKWSIVLIKLLTPSYLNSIINIPNLPRIIGSIKINLWQHYGELFGFCFLLFYTFCLNGKKNNSYILLTFFTFKN